jgi:integrase/recombinase XerD
VLKYIKDSGYSIPFDWREVEVPNVPTKQNEYLTKEELEKVLNSFDITTPAGIRTRALTEVLFATGMRISEAISLNKEDIDWEKKEAMVTNAKTKDVEKIYFTSRSIEWLKKYIDSRKDDLPALFVSGRGRMLSVTARNYLRTHTGHLGIKKHIKHHLFRKTFATHLIQGGADIIAVGDLCRHRSPRTTLRFYAAVNKERSKDKHQEILGRVLGGDAKPNKKSLKGELMEFEKWVSSGEMYGRGKI